MDLSKITKAIFPSIVNMKLKRVKGYIKIFREINLIKKFISSKNSDL